MKTEEQFNSGTTRDSKPRRGGVLWVGTSNIGSPLAPSLKKRYNLIADYVPHFVVAYHPGRRFRRFSDGVEFYLAPRDFPLLLRVPVFITWLWLVTVYLVLFRQVRVLVSQSPYEGFLMWLMQIPLRLLGRRLFLVVQVQGFSEEVLPLVHPFLRYVPFLWRWSLRWAIRRADLVRAISEATEVYVRSLGACRVSVYPTWSNWELFLEPSEVGGWHPQDTFSLLYAGTLTPVKGVDVLLEAITRLRQRAHPVTLTVAGDGPQEEALREMARGLGIGDVVCWKGRVPLERIKELMDSCFAFVCPSRTEGLGRVVLEAGACGKPVVASAVGGIPDAVENGRTGILVAPDDPDALAGGIERLILNPAEARSMGERGRQLVAQRYGTQAWLEAYFGDLEAAWGKLGTA